MCYQTSQNGFKRGFNEEVGLGYGGGVKKGFSREISKCGKNYGSVMSKIFVYLRKFCK
jgi:hypothetical protein